MRLHLRQLETSIEFSYLIISFYLGTWQGMFPRFYPHVGYSVFGLCHVMENAIERSVLSGVFQRNLVQFFKLSRVVCSLGSGSLLVLVFNCS